MPKTDYMAILAARDQQKKEDALARRDEGRWAMRQDVAARKKAFAAKNRAEKQREEQMRPGGGVPGARGGGGGGLGGGMPARSSMMQQQQQRQPPQAFGFAGAGQKIGAGFMVPTAAAAQQRRRSNAAGSGQQQGQFGATWDSEASTHFRSMDDRGQAGQLFQQQRSAAAQQQQQQQNPAVHGTQRTAAIAKTNASSAGNCLATHDGMLVPRPFEANGGRFARQQPRGAGTPQVRSNSDSTALW